ncbi:hypothetical protein CK203_034084 [Vitis vinifera]|uniref:Uncharacterized protein n=1 Tax=Vitis vinifera TaxID=29760 RepID=A0A438IB43_VITVI|nr:hypothetical protein CK203_034084 [Vitis vinifera]
MDEFSSNQATDSHTLHLGSNSNQVAADDATQTQTQIRSQSAAGDGSQAEIITMDASVYKAAADGNIPCPPAIPGKKGTLHFTLQQGRAFSGAESSHGCCKTASPDIEVGLGAEKAMLRLTNKGATQPCMRQSGIIILREGFGKLVEIIIDNTRTSPVTLASPVEPFYTLL